MDATSKRQIVTARLRPELVAAIERLASDEGRSVSRVVERLVERALTGASRAA